MIITKEFFTHLIQYGQPGMIRELDKAICGCHYCYHWKFNMQQGRFRPLINEMDHELRDVQTTGQLYDFLKKKQK